MEGWERTCPSERPLLKHTPTSVISTLVQTTSTYLTETMKMPRFTGARPTHVMYCASWLYITGVGSLQDGSWYSLIAAFSWRHRGAGIIIDDWGIYLVCEFMLPMNWVGL